MKFKISGGLPSKVLARIRLTPEQHQALKKLGKDYKISMQEVVRQMVQHCLSDSTYVEIEEKNFKATRP